LAGGDGLRPVLASSDWLDAISIQDFGWLSPNQDESEFFYFAPANIVRQSRAEGWRMVREPQRAMVGGARALWYELHAAFQPRPAEPLVHTYERDVLILARRRFWLVSQTSLLPETYAKYHDPFWTVVGSLQWL
jgi:hypothetical protein